MPAVADLPKSATGVLNNVVVIEDARSWSREIKGRLNVDELQAQETECSDQS
jgi:hypothetical protein